jgi:hypothetical protein
LHIFLRSPLGCRDQTQETPKPTLKANTSFREWIGTYKGKNNDQPKTIPEKQADL